MKTVLCILESNPSGVRCRSGTSGLSRLQRKGGVRSRGVLSVSARIRSRPLWLGGGGRVPCIMHQNLSEWGTLHPRNSSREHVSDVVHLSSRCSFRRGRPPHPPPFQIISTSSGHQNWIFKWFHRHIPAAGAGLKRSSKPVTASSYPHQPHLLV